VLGTWSSRWNGAGARLHCDDRGSRARSQARLAKPTTLRCRTSRRATERATERVAAGQHRPGAPLAFDQQTAPRRPSATRPWIGRPPRAALPPIAGLSTKAYLRKWLVWMERQGPAGLAPLAAAVGRQRGRRRRPSFARPSEHQTDEGDLIATTICSTPIGARRPIRDKARPRSKSSS